MTEAEQTRIQALVVKGAATRFPKGWRGGTGRPKGPVLPTPHELAGPYAREAVDKAVDLMRNAKDEKVQLAAAKAIIETARPDDDDKLLRLLEDRLRDLRAEADERRKTMEIVANGSEPDNGSKVP
jgi:hypothetical protein